VPNNPEKNLAAFLATLPAHKRKAFEFGLLSLTQDELNQINSELGERDVARTEYERLLRRIPAKWREYNARQLADLKAAFLPKNPEGRPRKDAFADEAKELKKRLSYADTARYLSQKYPQETFSAESVRGLLKSRRRQSRKAAPTPG
jgi:hypothetical protein